MILNAKFCKIVNRTGDPAESYLHSLLLHGSFPNFYRSGDPHEFSE